VTASEASKLERGEIGRHLEAICAIGNRYVGTAGEADVRDYILAHFRRAGLADIQVEKLDVRTYAPEYAACELPSWNLRLDCVGFQGTSEGEVEAEAVYLGGGESPEEILSEIERLPSLEGRIAVFQSFWPWELTDALVERDVAGVVLISDVPEDLIAHLPARWFGSVDPKSDHHPAPVPGVTVGARTGRRLVRALANGAGRLKLRHRAAYPVVTTANLTAQIPGTNPDGAETVLLAAHHDTFAAGPGAHDNATGLAALLAAASAWASRPAVRTITLASFAAEELGLCGSGEYCRRHAAELASIRAMINFDALAWCVAGPRCLVVHPALEAYARQTLTEIGWPPDSVWDARETSSDVAPFVSAGVPAAWCWRFPPQHPYFATERDSREFLDVDLVTETANAAALLAYRIASG
jgi:aminopeptidase YwaD